MKALKVKYTEANFEQMRKAQEYFYTKKNKLSSNLLNQPLAKDVFESEYPTYDKNGDLTLVGRAKRITDLQRKGLKEDTTVGEYLTKSWDDLQNDLANMIEKIQERFKF